MEHVLPVLIVLILIIAVAIVWWSRTSAKRPERAREYEADFDAGLERVKALTPASVDAVLSQIQAIDWQRIGADAYTRGLPIVQALREKADELRRMADQLERGTPGDR